MLWLVCKYSSTHVDGSVTQSNVKTKAASTAFNAFWRQFSKSKSGTKPKNKKNKPIFNTEAWLCFYFNIDHEVVWWAAESFILVTGNLQIFGQTWTPSALNWGFHHHHHMLMLMISLEWDKLVPRDFLVGPEFDFECKQTEFEFGILTCGCTSLYYGNR